MESSELPPPPPPPPGGDEYPLTFSVDYPDRELNRLSTDFRFFAVIPLALLAEALAGGSAAILFLPVLLMLLFRKKYPRWWYDWNLELTRFSSRIGVYLALMDDRYPSKDEEQRGW